MSDRVPNALWERGEDTTPTDNCSPHCHQAALIEGLGAWLQRRAETEDERHRALLAGLAELRVSVRTVQDQVVRLAVAQTEVATAEATAQHRAMVVRPAPDSLPPGRRGSRRLPAWATWVATGLGVALATAAAQLAELWGK